MTSNAVVTTLRFGVVSMLVGVLSTNAFAVGSITDDAYYDDFNAVLNTHVVEGQVDYPGIAADIRFSNYIEKIADENAVRSLPGKDQLPFWINAYNALAIQGILNGHSPASLFGRLRYFKRDEYTVGGVTTTLFDLEHKIIVPLGENRIHFAIVCASASCPILRSEAFLPSNLDAQLTDQANIFINNPTKNRIELDKGIARVSKIFKWFGDDFAAEAGSVQQYMSTYIQNDAVKSALAAEQLKVRFLKYHWDLNGIAPDS